MNWDLLIQKATDRLRPYVRVTPVNFSHTLSRELKSQIFLKMENQQISGSFKARGAFNKIISVMENEDKPGFFVTASTGNHAAGFGMALQALHENGKIFLPKSVTDSKLEFIKSLGISWEKQGENSLETELYVREMAEKQDWIFVPPYNDIEIVAGQGTIGSELLQQIPEKSLM